LAHDVWLAHKIADVFAQAPPSIAIAEFPDIVTDLFSANIILQNNIFNKQVFIYER
jgi:hypothetical protein